ncbi:MAG: transcription termination factor NusA [Deltaproteobacteria bacterium]|nr:MAG: transcription termination factor NusA [Deltaproteobacteria bacterium]
MINFEPLKLENLKLITHTIGKSKKLHPTTIINALKLAIKIASQKCLGTNSEVIVNYNKLNESLSAFQIKKIVLSDSFDPISQIPFNKAMFLDSSIKYKKKDIENGHPVYLAIPLNVSIFLRMATQTAKHLLEQKALESEQMLIYEKYRYKVGSIIPVIIKRFEKEKIIVSLIQARTNTGKMSATEGYIPIQHAAQETLHVGSKILALILNVLPTAVGPQIILSRQSPLLLSTLLTENISKLLDNVEIHAVAREAGIRSKVAVSSKASQFDPVGFCLGIKGEKIQQIVQELRGEKIDIIPFNQNDTQFICNSLTPAIINHISINEINKSMQVFVSDDQLSLAIGKDGINVRLASILTGWCIDVHSDSISSKTKKQANVFFSQLSNLNELQIKSLYDHGIKTFSDIIKINLEQLEKIPNLNLSSQQMIDIKSKAKRILEQKRLSSFFLRDFPLFAIQSQNTSLNLLVTHNIISKQDIDVLKNFHYKDLIDICFCPTELLLSNTQMPLEKIEKIKHFIKTYFNTNTIRQ